MACITKKRGKLVIDFYDQHGRRRLKTLPDGTRKKDAQKMLHETLKQVERGTYLPDKKIPTFREVAEQWLAYKKMNIREHTYESPSSEKRK